VCREPGIRVDFSCPAVLSSRKINLKINIYAVPRSSSAL